MSYAAFHNGMMGALAGRSLTIPFLTTYPGAAAAYSLRDLTGSDPYVVKARRSVDDAERQFTTGEISGGVLSAWAGAGSAYVTTWYDQSGNGANATQSTASAQPALVLSGTPITKNNLPAINFDGVDDCFAADSLAGALAGTDTPFSTFCVFSSSSQAGNIFGIGNVAVSGNVFSRLTSVSATEIGIYRRDEALRLVSHLLTPVDMIEQNIVVMTFSGVFVRLDVNGDLGDGASFNVESFAPLDRFTIGALRYNPSPNGNSFLSGTMQEFVIYNSDKVSVRDTVSEDINSYYDTYL